MFFFVGALKKSRREGKHTAHLTEIADRFNKAEAIRRKLYTCIRKEIVVVLDEGSPATAQRGRQKWGRKTQTTLTFQHLGDKNQDALNGATLLDSSRSRERRRSTRS